MKALSPQAAVRAQARDALKNQWPTAVIAFVIALIPLYLIDGLCTAIVCMITSLITDEALQKIAADLILYPVMLVMGLLLSPLFNGMIRLFYRNGTEGRLNIRDLIYFFNKDRYGRALRFNLSFALRMIIPVILFFLPAMIYQVICQHFESDFLNSVIYIDCSFILYALSVMLVVLYSLKYFFAFTIFAEDQEQSAGEIFRLSKRINYQFSGSAVKLLFSYTPWILLCMTILPILYVGPYLIQGLCIGAKWMRASYQETVVYPVSYARENL